MNSLRLAAAVAAAAAAFALSACSGSASPGSSPSSVIAPVTVSAGDLQGETVDLLMGQTLNINTGDLAVDSYRGTVADAAVATFVEGHDDGSAQFNPGVEALAPGTTTVTMTNTDGGIEPLEFTVVVTAK
ncbi:MAG: hypothetical protein NT132_07915 [Microbacterium sp.]|uniref:hypothetical protein n=1 Tax=Microbacterium sp. TaxID=51671 RepID=UPI00260A5901|nr:hypothetical protein [Microbacterium sp.]MCX6502312.1 hypothetical protein [Microbacterium sp.]